MRHKIRLISTGILFMALLSMAGCKKAAVSSADQIESPQAGLIFQIPQEYREKGVEVEGPFEDYGGNEFVCVSWYYKPVTDRLIDDMAALSPEERTADKWVEFYEQMAIHCRYLMNITLIEEQTYREAQDSGRDISELSYWKPVEELGTNEGYVYLLSIPEADTLGMSGEERAQYEECLAYMQTVKQNLIFTKISAPEGLPDRMPDFTAKDLNGNTVTESIFGEKDLTVVNIWGTFCTPCVGEMPELGEWARSMPDNVQLVGLISDISGDDDVKGHDLAVRIMEGADADFTQIIVNSDFDPIMKWVTGVPTTLFVDKDGNLVGEPIVGADVEGYKRFVEDYINGEYDGQ